VFASHFVWAGGNAAFGMLKLAGLVQTLGTIQDFEWFSKLKSNVTSVEDAECVGCPVMGKNR
jgi:hypothetical protein